MSDAPADQGGPGWPTGPTRPRNGMGTAALVLGIIGFLLAIVVVGGLLGIVAVVLGVVALGRVRRGEATNRGVAVAGIVTGTLAIVVAALIVVVGAAFWSENEDEIDDFRDCLEAAETDQAREDCAERFERELERSN